MGRANKKMCGVQKSLINTTIQTDVLDEFKYNCECLKVPMNYIIERFMEKFNSKNNLAIFLINHLPTICEHGIIKTSNR